MRTINDVLEPELKGPNVATKRKFFETIFTIKVLTEDTPMQGDVSLESISHDITDGDAVGDFSESSVRELTPKECADALNDIGSEPGFFNLDDDGNDLDNEEST